MAQVNLLPWREEARKYKKILFFARVLGCIILTIALLLAYHIYLSSYLSSQARANAYLQDQLNQEQVSLGALDKKIKQKKQTENDLQFILTLRQNSFRVVRLMDELVRVVPDNVVLNKLVRENNAITLIGRAQTDMQVTQFMKNLTESPYFNQPILTEISVKENDSGGERTFTLKVDLKDIS